GIDRGIWQSLSVQLRIPRQHPLASPNGLTRPGVIRLPRRPHHPLDSSGRCVRRQLSQYATGGNTPLRR
ncbi:MAG: hypothetical protein ACK56I_16550, partial [bacterium]